MRFGTLRTTAALAALCCATGLSAKVSQAEADRLGKELTPMGGVRAGNAEGTIPEWTGGITQPYGNHTPGEHYGDPLANDEVLFAITSENVDQYADKLTPGQQAMFKRYSGTFKMNIYPTRRTAAAPQYVYDAVKQNALNAELAPGGVGVVNSGVGPAFPIPQNGNEAIWNHTLRFVPPNISRVYDNAAPTAGGSYTVIRTKEEIARPYNKEGATIENTNNRLAFFRATTLAPAYRAGGITLIHEPIDQHSEPRQAWSYSTGTRRVRRAPNMAFDNPLTTGDGQANTDDFDTFNGSTERYDWKLVGKKEMYMPYNSYKLHSPQYKVNDIVQKGHINMDLPRYELHRVWVVEGVLKEDANHTYAKRVFFMDEDSWQILVQDIYDANGNIWRVAEAHPINYYDVPAFFTTTGTLYDLNNGRYLVSTMYNEGKPPKYDEEIALAEFTPQKLRSSGKR